MLRRLVGGLTLALVLIGFRGGAGPLPGDGFLQDIRFKGEGDRFGGFSALHLSADGTQFVALSDRGGFVTGTFARDAKGRILSIDTSPVTPLLGSDGKPLKKGRTDSEGLAVAPDGTTYVSFEGRARVQRYSDLAGPAQDIRSAPAFAEMEGNAALEALAIGPDGALYTMPEESGGKTTPFPVYRYAKGKWTQPFAVPRHGFFLISDATFGPDGRFYILERQFLGLSGFASRIRRFDLTKQGLTQEKTLFQTEPGTFDNLEGLSVWQSPTGLRATMISDDNFIPIFRSQIVEYQLPD